MHSFPKKSILIERYVLFVPVYPCRLLELTKMVRTRDLGTVEASKHLFACGIILKRLLSYMVNLCLTEAKCSV